MELGCSIRGALRVLRYLLFKNLLHDLWDHDHVVALRGGVAERSLDRKARLGHILGPHVIERKRVRRRFDAGDIDRLELLDVREHVAELCGKRRFLFRRQSEPREISHVVDVQFGRLGHGGNKRGSVQVPSRNATGKIQPLTNFA